MIHSNNNKKYFFEINKEERFNLFYFELKDEEGNIYLESWQFTNKTNCRNGIKTVIRNVKNKEFIVLVQISYNKWYCCLNTTNGIIIAFSQYFETKEEVINMIKDLKSLSLETPVIDKTK